ncbi:MAG TPA: hypothetical protein LFV66_03325 [Rickettsia endosymbiont of Bembidion lapponicum]|nr:hypothetical protein [Rickettsia endosymbiont of Bembidion lapponicum]
MDPVDKPRDDTDHVFRSTQAMPPVVKQLDDISIYKRVWKNIL